MKLSERKLRKIVRNEIRRSLNENRRGKKSRLTEDVMSPRELKMHVHDFANHYPRFKHSYKSIVLNEKFQQAIRDYAVSEIWSDEVYVSPDGWSIHVVCFVEHDDLADKLNKSPEELTDERVRTLLDPPRLLKNAVEGNGYGFEYESVGKSVWSEGPDDGWAIDFWLHNHNYDK